MQNQQAYDRYSAHRRDSLALLEMIAASIAREPTESVHWSHVGDAAHLREKLLEIAIGIDGGSDEILARSRIESTLPSSR